MSKAFRWLSFGVSSSLLLTLVLFSAVPATSAPGSGTAPVEVKNTSTNPVPVDIQDGSLAVTQSGSWRIGTFPTAPQGAFSVARVPNMPNGHVIDGPSDAGGFAITSATFANGSGTAVLTGLSAWFGDLDEGGCTSQAPPEVVLGPQVFVSPDTTVHLTFPEPFILASEAGPDACLVAGSGGWVTVVGYRLPR